MTKDSFGSMAGKVVLYTGAAGGLGLDTTLLMLETGARVVAVDFDDAKIAALKAAAEAKSHSGLAIHKIDMSDLEGLRTRLEAIATEVGGFDVVINNAAIYPSKKFEDYTLAEMQRVQTINVDAGIVCVQVALPWMKRKGWGRIVNISSITRTGGWADLTPYVQSKAAVVGLARAWAREFGAYGITVNAIAPGAFPTDAEKIHPDLVAYEKRILDSQAVKRRGNAADIANALMFLSSESSSFITGQTINVDGGWIMY